MRNLFDTLAYRTFAGVDLDQSAPALSGHSCANSFYNQQRQMVGTRLMIYEAGQFDGCALPVLRLEVEDG